MSSFFLSIFPLCRVFFVTIRHCLAFSALFYSRPSPGMVTPANQFPPRYLSSRTTNLLCSVRNQPPEPRLSLVCSEFRILNICYCFGFSVSVFVFSAPGSPVTSDESSAPSHGLRQSIPEIARKKSYKIRRFFVVLAQNPRFFVILASFFACFFAFFRGWTVLIEAKSAFLGLKRRSTRQIPPNFTPNFDCSIFFEFFPAENPPGSASKSRRFMQVYCTRLR